jgi:SGNH domain (fused to AT3 domains)
VPLTARSLASLSLALGALVAVSSSGLSAPPKLPHPGTSKQIARLVAASKSIKHLPSSTLPSIDSVENDVPGRYFNIPKTGCTTLTACVYGDVNSSKSIVLFGDSHAWMWLPAINPVAQTDGYKLVLIYRTDCPAASVLLWDLQSKSYDTDCDAERAAALGEISKSAPNVVLLASLTSRRYSAPGVLVTASQWEKGLEKTIVDLNSGTTRIGVIGDIPDFNYGLPQCLAAYPTDIQACGVTIPDAIASNRGLQGAELAAAAATGSLYINTLPWMCRKAWCSPVVGHFLPYLNQWHVDATFAEYLSGVFGKALEPILKS